MFVFHKNLFSTFKNISTARLFVSLYYCFHFKVHNNISFPPFCIYFLFPTYIHYMTRVYNVDMTLLRKNLWFCGSSVWIYFYYQYIPFNLDCFVDWKCLPSFCGLYVHKKGSDSEILSIVRWTRLLWIVPSKLFPVKFKSK